MISKCGKFKCPKGCLSEVVCDTPIHKCNSCGYQWEASHFDDNVVEMPKPVLDLSKPHFRCIQCGISTASDGDTECMCPHEIGPAWEPVEPVAGFSPESEAVIIDPPGNSVLLTLEKRNEIKSEIRGREANLDFIVELYQRILYLEKAVDDYLNKTPAPPPLG